MEADDEHVHIAEGKSPKEKKWKICLELLCSKTKQLNDQILGSFVGFE